MSSTIIELVVVLPTVVTCCKSWFTEVGYAICFTLPDVSLSNTKSDVVPVVGVVCNNNWPFAFTVNFLEIEAKAGPVNMLTSLPSVEPTKTSSVPNKPPFPASSGT